MEDIGTPISSFCFILSLFSYSAESVCSISNLLLSLLFLRVALPRLFLFGCDVTQERSISCAASINTLVCRCWRSACFPVWSCFSGRGWVDVLSSSSGMGAALELVCLAVCFLDGAAFYSCFLYLCFCLLEPQSASADGRSH